MWGVLDSYAVATEHLSCQATYEFGMRHEHLVDGTRWKNPVCVNFFWLWHYAALVFGQALKRHECHVGHVFENTGG